MSTVKKGVTVPAPEWAKHLRPYGKRAFWKRQRADDRHEATSDQLTKNYELRDPMWKIKE